LDRILGFAKGVSRVDIIFKGRRTEVREPFREHAQAKLSKVERLDRKAIRVDVELSEERNPRLAGQRERVELTIRSRGPLIRAEAAAADCYVAFDRAAAKLERQLRRLCDRRKAARHGLLQPGRVVGLRAVVGPRQRSAGRRGRLVPGPGGPGFVG